MHIIITLACTIWMRRSTSQIRTVRIKKLVFDKEIKAKRRKPLLWQLQEISYHIMQVELGLPSFGENHQFEQLWPIVPLPVISNDSFDTFMFFRHHQAN